MPRFTNDIDPPLIAKACLLASLGVCLSACSPKAPLLPLGPAAVVVGTPVTHTIVEWDEYTGRLEAVDSIEVRARVSGYLTSIHFAEGEMVKKGDLLFVIDPRPFEAEVGSAESEVAEAQAGIGERKAQLVQAEANKEAADSRLDLANRQLARVDKLLPTRAISQEEYDVQVAEAKQARAQVAARAADIEAAKAAVGTALSGVESAKARLRIAALNLQYTRVYAPISGRMSRHMVTEGNLISGGSEQSTLLSTIVSIDPIHCYFDADEQAFLKYARLAIDGTRASSREVKNPVFVALADEQAGFPHTGHMDFVDNRIDRDTGTIRGRAILANGDHVMVPGLFVRVRLPGSGRHEAVLLPDYAIGIDQSEKFVYVVDGDTVRRQTIETGPISHGLRIVRKGLTGSEQVVLRGLQRVRPGATVAATVEEIVVGDDEGLPDDYEPVPRERWLSQPPAQPGADSPAEAP